MRLISGAVALLLAVGVLAGCGDGPKPEAVARDYVATNAATKCDVLDPALVEQLTGKQGDAALAACRHNVTRVPAPTQVKVQGVKDEGTGEDPDAEGGVAEVRLVADGRPAEVRLRRQDGTWKIVGLGD